jgi:hypothetical protein
MNLSNIIICPGCGWADEIAALSDEGQCPNCDFTNGRNLVPDERLLTVAELLADNDNDYVGVNVGAFARALLWAFRVDPDIGKDTDTVSVKGDES